MTNHTIAPVCDATHNIKNNVNILISAQTHVQLCQFISPDHIKMSKATRGHC